MIEAVRADAAAAGVAIAVRTARERPWASATFSGARHALTLSAGGDAAAVSRWIAALPEAELALAHHIAADVTAEPTGDGLFIIEVLTVEAA